MQGSIHLFWILLYIFHSFLKSEIAKKQGTYFELHATTPSPDTFVLSSKTVDTGTGKVSAKYLDNLVLKLKSHKLIRRPYLERQSKDVRMILTYSKFRIAIKSCLYLLLAEETLWFILKLCSDLPYRGVMNHINLMKSDQQGSEFISI